MHAHKRGPRLHVSLGRERRLLATASGDLLRVDLVPNWKGSLDPGCDMSCTGRANCCKGGACFSRAIEAFPEMNMETIPHEIVLALLGHE